MKLLYISPVIPALQGNGLAMRAGIVLEALASIYEVSLYVNPIYPPFGDIPEHFANLCQRIDCKASAFDPNTFDTIHVFRIAGISAVSEWLTNRSALRCKFHLDLDDIESLTFERIAQRCLKNGDMQLALQHFGLARRSSLIEQQVLPSFDQIYVCSETDRLKLAPSLNSELRILPNAIRPPATVAPRPINGPMLFVGNLSYYPNEDACRYLARDIAPLIPEARFQIVGTGVSDRLRSLVAHPTVEILGEFDDIAAAYAEASAVVVPIHAGGGTRIKILEAFAFERPVITTTLGLEGIDARHAEHVLIADTPTEFAAAYHQLHDHPQLAASLTTNASTLLKQRYTLEAITQRLTAFS